jgi:importin subunit beta-1
MTLASASTKAGTFASQVVAAIAAVELPQGQWPELIEILLGFVNNPANTQLKIATLQTIGFICESIVCISSFLIQCLSSEFNHLET